MSNMSLKSKEEISGLIAQETLIPPDAMNPNLFRMYYDCPCGGQHPLPTCNHILCAFPHKFFINCENNIVTLVNIKGLIKQTLVEEWSCKLDSFLSVMEVHLGDDQNVENDNHEKTIKRDISKSEDDQWDNIKEKKIQGPQQVVDYSQKNLRMAKDPKKISLARKHPDLQKKRFRLSKVAA